MEKPNRLTTTILDMYRDWEDKELKKIVSKEQFDLILSTVNHYIAKTLIEDAGMVALPYNSGALGILRYKNPYYPIPRFDLMVQTGVATPNMNWHSGGWYAKIGWIKKQPYCQIPTRSC